MIEVSRTALAFLVCLGLIGCGLPRSGPTNSEVNKFLSDAHSGAFLVPIDKAVAREATTEPSEQVPSWVRKSVRFTQDTILPGDRLTITVYENVDDGLLSVGGQPTIVSELQVEAGGMVVLPYAGRIRAAGNTVETVRNTILRRLEDQTPNPQVLIHRTPGTTASISVLGDIAGGSIPFDGTTRTLLRAVSVAGGFGDNPDTISVTLIRGDRRATMAASGLLDGSVADVNLHPGDVIVAKKSTAQFTALGYFGAQALVNIPSGGLSLIEALGAIGGLNPTASNPSGVFVFRREDKATAVNLGYETDEAQVSIAYGLDLRDPESFYTAGLFMVEDNDVIYVTQAPFARLTSILTSITTPVQSAAGLATTATSN